MLKRLLILLLLLTPLKLRAQETILNGGVLNGGLLSSLSGSTPTVATPVDSPGAGSYTVAQTITISTSTSGATICYRVDGGVPTATVPGTCDAGSTTYTSGFTSPSSTFTLKAIGTKASYFNSAVDSSTYTINICATPVDSPGTGTYANAQTITITSGTAGATICFTEDGTTPTASAGSCTHGTTYSGPFISPSSTFALNAIASKSGFTNSGLDTSNYTITTGGSHYITLTWSPPLTGLTYDVYRGTSSGTESGTPINPSPVNTTSYVDSTPTAGTMYFYVAKAINSSSQFSIASNESYAGVGLPFYVQGANTSIHSTSSTLSATFSMATTASNSIMVGVDYVSGVTVSSVTDSQGNTFNKVGSELTTPGSTSSEVWYAQGIIGGSDTVTVTLTGSVAIIELYAAEYYGVAAVDSQAGSTGSGSSVSVAVTTSDPWDLLFGYCVGDSNCSAGSGFNTRLTLDGNLVEDGVGATSGSYNVTATSSAGWSMQAVALKPQL